MKTRTSLFLFLMIAAVACGWQAPASAAQEVNLYSYRQPFLIKPFLEEFTRRTGIQVNVVYAKRGMLNRIRSEGRNTKADGILTTDISRLDAHVKAELLQPVRSAVLEKNIPAHLRDPDGLWFALTKRVRLIAVSKARVKPGAVGSYEDLAKPEFKGRICVRKGSHVYNRALLASMIAAHGPKKAQAWARGLVANLARKPQGNDRAQIKAITQGVCDIALINNYYYGQMKFNTKKPEQQEWAKAVDLVFPNQKDRGVHINISGAAMVKYAKNRENMVKLLEFLSGDVAQAMYASRNYEYPANPAVAVDKEVASWGSFTEDKVSLRRIAELSPAAQKIVDRVGW